MMPVADDNDAVNPLAMSGDGFASTLARYGLATSWTALHRANVVKKKRVAKRQYCLSRRD